MKATVMLFDSMGEAMHQAQEDFAHKDRLWVGYTYRLTDGAVHLVPPDEDGHEYIYIPRPAASEKLRCLPLPESTLVMDGERAPMRLREWVGKCAS